MTPFKRMRVDRGAPDQICNMLWIGERLGHLERACMRSVLRQGHDVRLWSYKPVEGVPAGVERAEAAHILPESAIIRHQASGSVALFSNWFRYELQVRSLGTWLDCDVYLVRPLEMRRAYLLAEEEPCVINGSVLRLPIDSPILRPLLRLFKQRSIPFWLPKAERLAAMKRLILTGQTGLSLMRWGVAGPAALTALTERHGLLKLAQAPEVYHPVHWRDASWIADPTVSYDHFITPRTRGIHLWSECIKEIRHLPAESGTFLSRLREEGN